jgi:hypothetical protein
VFYISISAIPYINYIAFKDIIVKNLCENRDRPELGCQGKCYLDKQIKKSKEIGDSMDRTAGKKVQYKDVKDYVNSYFTIYIVLEINTTLQVIDSETFITKMFVSDIFIPPRLKPVS